MKKLFKTMFVVVNVILDIFMIIGTLSITFGKGWKDFWGHIYEMTN